MEKKDVPHAEEKKQAQVWWQPALMMFARMSAWIVAPVLLGTILGKWLDTKFGTEPWLLVGTVGFAFLISMFGLVKNVVAEYKKIEKDINSEKHNK